MLGDLDQQVQKYLKSLRTAGTAISAPLVIAATQGMIEAKDRTLLVEHGDMQYQLDKELGNFTHAEDGVCEVSCHY